MRSTRQSKAWTSASTVTSCPRPSAPGRLLAKLVAAYGAFDAADLWDLDAATSMSAWLREQADLTGGDAARVLRLARGLRGMPVTAAAVLDGTLSAGQVRAIVANVNDRTAELFAAHEAELVPTLPALSAGDVTVAMRTWAALALGGRPAPSRADVSTRGPVPGVIFCPDFCTVGPCPQGGSP
jgi:hypothetical protein